MESEIRDEAKSQTVVPPSAKGKKKPNVTFGGLLHAHRLWWMMDVTDAGCREFFVIDGDSLLAHFLLNPYRHKLLVVRKQTAKASSSIISGLQLFWLIERFLLALNQRNCFFDIVFFESNSAVWINEAGDVTAFRFLVLRKMLIEHLTKLLPNLPRQPDDTRSKCRIQLFDDWLSGDWLAYCDQKGPRFLLTSTGRTEISPDTVAKIWEQRKLIWHGMALSMLTSGLCSVVKFERLHLNGNRIKADIANATTFRRVVKEEIQPAEFSIVIGQASRVISETRRQYDYAGEYLKLVTSECTKKVGVSAELSMFAVCLTTFSKLCQKKDVKIGKQFAVLACLTHVIAQTVSLRQRNRLQAFNRLIDQTTSFRTVKRLLGHFARAIYFAIDAGDKKQNCCFPNFFDELLFMNLLCELVTWKRQSPEATLCKLLGGKCYQLANDLCKLSKVADNLEVLQVDKLLDESRSSFDSFIPEQLRRPKPFAINNQLFKEILGDALPSREDEKTEDDNSDNESFLSKFMEETHWHCDKKLESGSANAEQQQTGNNCRRKRQNKPKADSDVLWTTRNISNQRPNSASSEVYDQSMRELDDFLKSTEKQPSVGAKLQYVSKKVISIASSLMTDPYTSARIRLLQLELIEKSLSEQINAETYSNVCDLKIQAFDCIKTLLVNLPKKMREDKILRILSGCLSRFGFHSCAEYVASIPRATDCDEHNNGVPLYDFPFKSAIKNSNFLPELAYHTDPEFQMCYCGKFFDRCSDQQEDSRVEFIPDAWQRELLDVVDRNESALVCAPTSSGKTFIAFYAMGKALRSKTDDLVIYFSPTKALVNQVADEIKARFPKQLESVGVYTRDFRFRQFDCRVLVCVPQILEILLLSPVLTQMWIPRLKRIIFDEVYSMGERDGGVVWEHLLLMAPCPILALSASVANYSQLFDWMKDSQDRKGFKMHLITSARRYCELQKFIYAPKARKGNEDKSSSNEEDKSGWVSSAYRSEEAVGNLIRVNPFAGISPSSLIERGGFPSNFKLLPDECIKIYSKLRKIAAKKKVETGANFKHLEPNIFFRDQSFLTRDDAEAYETKLKDVVLDG